MIIVGKSGGCAFLVAYLGTTVEEGGEERSKGVQSGGRDGGGGPRLEKGGVGDRRKRGRREMARSRERRGVLKGERGEG